MLRFLINDVFMFFIFLRIMVSSDDTALRSIARWMLDEEHYTDALTQYQAALIKSPEKIWILNEIVDCQEYLQLRNVSEWNNLRIDIETTLQIYDDQYTASNYKPVSPVAVPGRSAIYYALYKASEKSGYFHNAWKYLEIATNIESRQRTRHIITRSYMEIQQLGSLFNSKILQNIPGSDNGEMIFIVGMPNTGMDILASILDKHTSIFCLRSNKVLFERKVRGAMDYDKYFSVFISNMKQLSQMLPELLQQGLSSASGDHFPKVIDNVRRHLMKEWIGSVYTAVPDEKTTLRYMVDFHHKLYRYIGYLHILFPNSIIINVMRSPLDTLFGCYRSRHPQFLGLEWTLLPEELQQEYVFYLSMMDFWHELLPDRIIDISGDALLEDPRTEVSPILRRLGLSWEASSMGRIDPVQRSTVPTKGLWREYSNHMQSLSRPHVSGHLNSGSSRPWTRSMNIDWSLDLAVQWSFPMRRNGTGGTWTVPSSRRSLGVFLADIGYTSGLVVNSGDGREAMGLLEDWSSVQELALVDTRYVDASSDVRDVSFQGESSSSGADRGISSIQQLAENRLSPFVDRVLISYSSVADDVAGSFDVIYMMGLSSYCQTESLLQTYMPKLRPGGLIIGNNYAYDRLPTYHADFDVPRGGTESSILGCSSGSSAYYQTPRAVKGAVDDFAARINADVAATYKDTVASWLLRLRSR